MNTGVMAIFLLCVADVGGLIVVSALIIGWITRKKHTPEQTVQATGNSKNNGKAVASLVLGIIGLIAWLVPIFGLVIAIIGIVLGIIGLNSWKTGMAVSGLVLSILCFIATNINFVFGLYIASHMSGY